MSAALGSAALALAFVMAIALVGACGNQSRAPAESSTAER